MSNARLFCTVLMIAATVYDVLALQLGGVDATISHWFKSFQSYPVVMIGIGFLLGHWFGAMSPVTPQGDTPESKAAGAKFRAIIAKLFGGVRK